MATYQQPVLVHFWCGPLHDWQNYVQDLMCPDDQVPDFLRWNGENGPPNASLRVHGVQLSHAVYRRDDEMTLFHGKGRQVFYTYDHGMSIRTTLKNPGLSGPWGLS